MRKLAGLLIAFGCCCFASESDFLQDLGPNPEPTQTKKEFTTAILKSIRNEKSFLDGPGTFESKDVNTNLIKMFLKVRWRCSFPIQLPAIGDFGPHQLDPTGGDYIQKIEESPCQCGNEDMVDEVLDRCGPLGEIIKKIINFSIPVAFWEPMMLIEVTPIPYRFLIFGGDYNGTVTGRKTSKNRGGITVTDSGRTSFYNVHVIPFWLYRLPSHIWDIPCLEKKFPKIGMTQECWITEFDPTWRREELTYLFNPYLAAVKKHAEMVDFSCQKECMELEENGPTVEHEKLWFCAGCLGSFYPFTGHVGQHIGGVQASSLLVQRTLGKRHAARYFNNIPTGFDQNNYCEEVKAWGLRKTNYKTQLLYPIADGYEKDDKFFCRSLGAQTNNHLHSDKAVGTNWGQSKTSVEAGEDFVYVVWTKKQCCIKVKDILIKFFPNIEKVLQNVKDIIKIFSGVENIIDFLDSLESSKDD